MDSDHVLKTTRSVRKRLDFDRPVPPELIEECLELALQAPSGSNQQGWRFLVVTDPQVKLGLADLYRKSFSLYAKQRPPSHGIADVRTERMSAVVDSATFLAENMEKSPALIVPCIEGKCEGQPLWMQAGLWGSILPATWSLMLALRSRGLGSAYTTLHLLYEKESNELLKVPEGFLQAALLPVAYFTGDDFKPAARLPVAQVTYWNQWGAPRPASSP